MINDIRLKTFDWKTDFFIDDALDVPIPYSGMKSHHLLATNIIGGFLNNASCNLYNRVNDKGPKHSRIAGSKVLVPNFYFLPPLLTKLIPVASHYDRLSTMHYPNGINPFPRKPKVECKHGKFKITQIRNCIGTIYTMV